MLSSQNRRRATNRFMLSTAARPVFQPSKPRMEADQWKVIAWFPQVKVRVLRADEVQHYDPSGLAFWNVNTPEEFSKAEEIAQSNSR